MVFDQNQPENNQFDGRNKRDKNINELFKHSQSKSLLKTKFKEFVFVGRESFGDACVCFGKGQDEKKQTNFHVEKEFEKVQ